jgi:predicted methyltransferase MtxX (methanogen marker protein 4)
MSLPVGIDEGWSVKARIEMTERSVAFMRKLGLENPRIAVMSGGRLDDRGRCDVVDKTLDQAVEIVDALKAKGYDAYDAQILIEDAIDHADIIVAPNGIVGNLIFRITHFIGGLEALGAPVLNTDKVFVDTSRVKTDFSDCIAVAMKLAGMKE